MIEIFFFYFIGITGSRHKNPICLREDAKKTFFIFSIPVAATINFNVSRVGIIGPLLVGHFGPIRDTIKL